MTDEDTVEARVLAVEQENMRLWGIVLQHNAEIRRLARLAARLPGVSEEEIRGDP